MENALGKAHKPLIISIVQELDKMEKYTQEYAHDANLIFLKFPFHTIIQK